MDMFQLTRARDIQDAVRAGAAARTSQHGADVRYLAGGTTLIDLMKLDVERPVRVIDIAHLGLDRIEPQAGGGVRIGAMVRNADLANDETIKRDYAVLSQALLAGASAQLRNMATTGGNLLQRTRCVYFRDTAAACNKREPGTGCSAIGGYNRNLAILGTSGNCIASNPSDMNVAMMALEATVNIQGAQGERAVSIGDFYTLPGDAPERETVLQPGDLITHVTLSAPAPGSRSVYVKLRDRASYEFALASAAVIITVENGTIAHARVALGGVGTRPWRSPEAEAALQGNSPSEEVFNAAAHAALKDARPQSQNAFKVELARRCLVHTLKQATQAAQTA